MLDRLLTRYWQVRNPGKFVGLNSVDSVHAFRVICKLETSLCYVGAGVFLITVELAKSKPLLESRENKQEQDLHGYQGELFSFPLAYDTFI